MRLPLVQASSPTSPQSSLALQFLDPLGMSHALGTGDLVQADNVGALQHAGTVVPTELDLPVSVWRASHETFETAGSVLAVECALDVAALEVVVAEEGVGGARRRVEGGDVCGGVWEGVGEGGGEEGEGEDGEECWVG
jgi:hypothetical protein